MNFKIIEHKLQGKCRNATLCEDMIIMNDNFICVIDGATSKTTLSFDGASTAKVAGKIIEETLRSIPHDIKCVEFIEMINNAFCQFYTKQNMIDHMKYNTIDRLSASVAIVSIYNKELWMIGDCQAMVDNKLIYNNKSVDKLLSSLRSFIINDLLISGVTIENLLEHDKARDAIMPFLKKQFSFQNNNYNNPFSYAVLDGFTNSLDADIIDISSNNSIVIASDGYPKLYNNLAESESYLRMVLDKDPLCYNIYKSTKGVVKDNFSYDDRAYVKIALY